MISSISGIQWLTNTFSGIADLDLSDARTNAMAASMHVAACPFLPQTDEACDYRILRQHGDRRDTAFYESALRYAQHLWVNGHAGRALLAATRALYADVPPSAPILQLWPLPYAAMAWMLRHHHSDDFPGNPRLSYQHQATRLRGERCELRRARAWAVWALASKARPNLPGDADCPEPSLAEISAALKNHGHPSEQDLWRQVFDNLT